jgi:hypothetical protein
MTLYLVVPPSDISRTKPLVRLILNQIGRRLTEDLQAKGRRHRLLFMLDEFPALGRLDFFESALAFMAGYGLKCFLIAQSLNQCFDTSFQVTPGEAQPLTTAPAIADTLAAWMDALRQRTTSNGSAFQTNIWEDGPLNELNLRANDAGTRQRHLPPGREAGTQRGALEKDARAGRFSRGRRRQTRRDRRGSILRRCQRPADGVCRIARRPVRRHWTQPRCFPQNRRARVAAVDSPALARSDARFGQRLGAAARPHTASPAPACGGCAHWLSIGACGPAAR